MKELAVVRLTKSIFTKAGKKMKVKKEQWAKEAALSVEETKRREAEFKEDFKVLKSGLEKKKVALKERVDSTVHAGEEAVKTAEEEYKKKVGSTQVATESKADKAPKDLKESTKEVEKNVTPKKKEAPKKETSSKKSASKNAEDTTKKSEKKAAKKTTKSNKNVSKRDEKIALYEKHIKKYYNEVDQEFLTLVVKNLGPSIYRKDAELVSCSDPKELETVRKNFLEKKLGLSLEKEALDAAIKEVCTELKASRTKYRATFYYALAKKFKKESLLS